MCDEKKYNPQGGSILPRTITQGRLRCTCQPCAIESITPMGWVMAHRVVWSYRMCNTVGYGHTLRLAWAIECTMDNGTPQCLMEIGRGGACVPARVAPQGRIRRSSPRTMRVFLLWKRRYADVRAGTQAPPLQFRLGRLRVAGWHRSCAILPVSLYAFSFFMLFISVAFIFSMDSDEGI